MPYSYNLQGTTPPLELLKVSEEIPHLGWSHHADFDLVHTFGCGVCASYMDHTVQLQHQPSFQAALQARDTHRKAGYFEGYADGRRHQRDDDEVVYTERDRFREEFIEAVEVISRCKLEISGNLDALRLVTDQLQSERAERDILRKQVEDLTKENLGLTDRLQNLDKGEAAQVSPRPGPGVVPSQVIEVTSTPSPTLSWKEEPPALPTPPHSTGTSATYASVASSQPANLSASSMRRISSGQPVTFLPVRSPDAAQPSAQSSPPAALHSLRAIAVASPFVSRPVTSIPKMRSLIIAAHQPGNEEILARVKSLCTEAHATPQGQKTDIQKYLLIHWRNLTPGSELSMASSLPLPSNVKGSLSPRVNPRMDDPVEVWYEYLCTHRTSWPRGVRRDAHNKPHLADLKASRTVARLRPDVDSAGSSTARMEFMGRVAELFSVVGGYKEHLRKNKIKIAPKVTFRVYHGAAPITLDDVARHFARCGVTLAAATEELEPRARFYQASTPTA
ncbi:hypothetical protein Hypma_014837 [Hypsizygus marmoreus]|uniref:Uncharacterized protein n=1 Tax=Hypsizygus marmoreus TaxID=39966 RepID=A0A369K741_HYPMA|nr:hypothetical protein Hypma_014837 [Hypsizygus marmoreus]